MKCVAQNELETAVDWTFIWRTAKCKLLCTHIDSDNYELNFFAKKGEFSFDVYLTVPAYKIELLMGGSFPLGETHKLYNNFELPKKMRKPTNIITAKYEVVGAR